MYREFDKSFINIENNLIAKDLERYIGLEKMIYEKKNTELEWKTNISITIFHPRAKAAFA